jgi:protein TonB
MQRSSSMGGPDMFGDILEAEGSSPSHPIAPLGFAVGVHLALLSTFLFASFLVIERIVDPPVPMVLTQPTVLPIVDLRVTESPGGPSGPVSLGTPLRKPPEPAPQEPAQPLVVNDQLDIPSSPLPEGPIDEGSVGVGPPGAPDGIPGIPTGGSGGPDESGSGAGGPGTPGGPILIDHSVVKPELVTRVQPDYPETARKARLQGRVILEAIIAHDGTVEDVRVLSATNPLFVEPAENAVLRWRYRPAMQNGLPVAVYFTVEVRFVLQ